MTGEVISSEVYAGGRPHRRRLRCRVPGLDIFA